MKSKITAGITGHIARVFIRDSSSASGAGLTGLAYNTSGLVAYYSRVGATGATQITLANATLGTFTSGGFKELDATNMPGVYELHMPNAAVAAGAPGVHVLLRGAANMVPTPLEIELDTLNYKATGGKVPATIAAGDIATDAIDANALKADAVTEIVTGVWASGSRTLTGFGFTVNTNANATETATKSVVDTIAATLIIVEGDIGDLQLDVTDLVNDVATILADLESIDLAIGDLPDNTALAAALTDVNTMADRYLPMIELDSLVYRFTVNALENGPTGTGGGGGDVDTEAIVDGVLAGLTDTPVIIPPAPVITGSPFRLIRGSAYPDAENWSPRFSVLKTMFPGMSAATVAELRIYSDVTRAPFTFAAAVREDAADASKWQLFADLTSADTAQLPLGVGLLQFWCELPDTAKFVAVGSFDLQILRGIGV